MIEAFLKISAALTCGMAMPSPTKKNTYLARPSTPCSADFFGHQRIGAGENEGSRTEGDAETRPVSVHYILLKGLNMFANKIEGNGRGGDRAATEDEKEDQPEDLHGENNDRVPENLDADHDIRVDIVRSRDQQGYQQHVQGTENTHFLIRRYLAEAAKIGTQGLGQDAPELGQDNGQEEGLGEIAVEKQQAADQGAAGVDDTGDGLDRDESFSVEPPFIVGLLGCSMEDEISPGKEALQ